MTALAGPATGRSGVRDAALGMAASTALLALYALGGDAAWPLGFLMLVPWLLALDRVHGAGAALAHGLLMAVATTLAAFHWFGAAIGDYLGVGTGAGIALLALAAPLLQPQWIAFALLRQALRHRLGLVLAASAATAAWVGTEALIPKLLGDTLGHGLAPATLLRQAADLGGAAGLTVALLASNEALAQAVRARRAGPRAWAPALLLAAALPAALAAYGAARLQQLAEAPPAPAAALRVALVQANQADYEQRRREVGAYAVVREALDAHYGLSMAALGEHGADVLLWSETVYPTPFGAPRSEDGARFDAEIRGFVDAMGVPLLFGSYEVDAAGEYNAAILLEPGRGRVGAYRKTHPFPLTEHVPGWLDAPWLRRALPWTGDWRPGDGARLLPLRSADGREVQVQALICLDDTRPQLAIDAARLGAQALLGMSNDSWFTDWPAGARLHLAVARFRSIETRLPQLRVTTNGLSALVDATGEVPVQTAMGQQAVLTGVIAARDPAPTLMVAWGDWVWRAALAFLAVLGLWLGLRRAVARDAGIPPLGTLAVAVLSPRARLGAALLRLAALAGLALSAAWMATRIGWQVQALEQLWLFGAGVVLPLLAAAAITRAGRASLRIDGDTLCLAQGHRRIEIPRAAIVALRPWRCPLPGAGLDLVLRSGARWRLRLDRPDALLAALATHGGSPSLQGAFAERRLQWAAARGATRRRIDHGLLKFGLFPLLPAAIAFPLHQRITFGGAFGEWQAFGAGAWFGGLAIWWASWSLGLMVLAAVLRIAIEALAVTAHAVAEDGRATAWRAGLEDLARLAFYLGVPGWLLWRVLAG